MDGGCHLSLTSDEAPRRLGALLYLTVRTLLGSPGCSLGSCPYPNSDFNKTSTLSFSIPSSPQTKGDALLAPITLQQ